MNDRKKRKYKYQPRKAHKRGKHSSNPVTISANRTSSIDARQPITPALYPKPKSMTDHTETRRSNKLPGLYGKLDENNSVKLLYHIHEKDYSVMSGTTGGVSMELNATYKATNPRKITTGKSTKQENGIEQRTLVNKTAKPYKDFHIHTEERICSSKDNYAQKLRDETSKYAKKFYPLAYEIQSSKVPCEEKCIYRYVNKPDITAKNAHEYTFNEQSNSYLHHWGIDRFLCSENTNLKWQTLDGIFKPDPSRPLNYCWLIVYSDPCDQNNAKPYAICARNLDQILEAGKKKSSQSSPNSSPHRCHHADRHERRSPLSDSQANASNEDCNLKPYSERGKVEHIVDITTESNDLDGFTPLFEAGKQFGNFVFRGLDQLSTKYIRWFLLDDSDGTRPNGPPGRKGGGISSLLSCMRISPSTYEENLGNFVRQFESFDIETRLDFLKKLALFLRNRSPDLLVILSRALGYRPRILRVISAGQLARHLQHTQSSAIRLINSRRAGSNVERMVAGTLRRSTQQNRPSTR